MSVKVTLQTSGHQFTVLEGESILDGALRAGINLPYSCRGGACGSCKGTVVQGEVDHAGSPEAALPLAERAAGKALFCTARPLTDLVIEGREIAGARDIQVKLLPARVQKLERLADDVMGLWLKLPASERLQFLAGQYIDILMKDGKRRSFSLANAPHDDEFLQLHIRYMKGGEFTEHVFNTMKEKEILRFQGPLGSFFLREDSDKPLIFLASGTGFAPIKGIYEHMRHSGIDRPVVLYWGARTRKDIYLFDLAASWQQENPAFSFIPVLSEALPADEWQGRTGLVHEAVLADFADLSGYEVYACGNPLMVDAAHRALIAERGLPETAFYSDAFYTSADATRKLGS